MLCGSTRKSSSSTTSKEKKKVDWRIKRKTDRTQKGESIGIIQVSTSQYRHFISRYDKSLSK
jgi:hypothetical protein